MKSFCDCTSFLKYRPVFNLSTAIVGHTGNFLGRLVEALIGMITNIDESFSINSFLLPFHLPLGGN